MRTWTVLALTVAVVACGSANGDLTRENGYPDATLEVTIEHPEAETVSYEVSCGGDTSDVDGVDLDAERACAALSDSGVRSRLVAGPTENQVCTEIYGGPDVATISGSIDDQEVATQVDRTNGCGISDWDEVLDELLPTARGVTG